MKKEDTHDTYVHGYTTASWIMSERTADNFAGFFTRSLKPGMTVLDVGCGPGTISLGLASEINPGQLIGIDVGASEIDRAVHNAANAGVTNATFQVADATKLPFSDREFDAVFACATLEHVPDVTTALDEIRRVLRPGGIVGLKSGSPSRHMTFPDIGLMAAVAAVYLPVWEHLGGHPELGVEQVGLLLSKGFQVLSVTGTFESRTFTDDYAARITSDRFVQLAGELGVAQRDELESLADRIRKCASDPDAGSLVAWIEVLARRS
jgi:ubiquinone/menaquinone biosynthesis C-methylase UbiE